MVVNVWNLKTKFKVASNKIACKVKGIAFTRDGSFFVTVGNRHVKYWYLTVSSLMETVPLKGRAAILGEMRNSYFCDVVCGTGECVHSTYTITTNGVLCEFNNEQRCITRNIELRTEHAYCIYADNRENLFIGCSNGSILMYRQKNLDLLASLPRPHSLGVDISKGLDMRHIIENLGNHELKYPDCVALCYDNHEGIISAIYNDHSFYVWDIKDPNKVKKLDSHLFHSSCCWSLDTFAGSLNNSQCSQQLNLPLDSFITCSSDNTVRIWSTNTTVTPGAMLKRNIYSKELLKIIYIENDLSALCEIDPTSENADQLPNQQSIQQQQQQQQTVANSVTNLPVGSINNMNVNSNELANNSKMGARCLKISPFGKHLATGDRNGNIR
jgi:WD40 repeat protein